VAAAASIAPALAGPSRDGVLPEIEVPAEMPMMASRAAEEEPEEAQSDSDRSLLAFSRLLEEEIDDSVENKRLRAMRVATGSMAPFRVAEERVRLFLAQDKQTPPPAGG
jgi:hypothetical protein